MSLDDRIDAIFQRPADQGVSLAMVVVHHGDVVGERYGVQPANIFEPEKVITAESPLLSWSVAKSITHAAVGILGRIVGGGRDGMERFLRERLFDPCGMTSAELRFDPTGTWVGSTYVFATTRDFARFGELYRNDGIAESGERVVPAGWADHGRTFVAHDAEGAGRYGFDYGRHWWMWPEFPGSIAAHGYEGQYIVVVPDRQLTLVHLGKTEHDQRPQLVAALGELIETFPVTGASDIAGVAS